MTKLKKSELARLIVSCFLAFVLGIFGWGLLFTELGPGETLAGRDLATVLFNLVFGLIFGLVNARSWPYAGLLAWGGILIALRGLFSGPAAWPDALTVIGISPLPAFAGAYLGRLLARKRNTPSSA